MLSKAVWFYLYFALSLLSSTKPVFFFREETAKAGGFETGFYHLRDLFSRDVDAVDR